MYKVVFEVLIGMYDIRNPVPNGALYEPGLALSGEIVMPDCIKLPIPVHGFGKTLKIPLFLQNTVDNRFKNKRSQKRLEGRSSLIWT
jgi:hypothetical protein